MEQSPIKIESKQHLYWLMQKIKNKEEFACSFQFTEAAFQEAFLNALLPDDVCFEERYFYFDPDRNLHIAESENGCFWISTMGLVATGKVSDNKYMNAFASQKFVLTAILDSAEIICNSESVYDVDSFRNGQLKELTPAIWQNYVFFFEIFGKAYLSISGHDVEHGHHISSILTQVKETMYEMYHNDTLFHAYAIPSFEGLVNHINRIPGKFNEAFIKYDDNNGDTTQFSFSGNTLKEIREIVSFCDDFIWDYYLSKDDPLYLKPGLYTRLWNKAPNEEARKVIEQKYSFLTKKLKEQMYADTGMDRKRQSNQSPPAGAV